MSKIKIYFYSKQSHDYLTLFLEALPKAKRVRFRALIKKILFFQKNFVVHLQFLIKTYEFLLILFLVKIRKIPLVWTPHDIKPLSRRKKYPWLNFFLKMVDKIIVLSQANKKDLIGQGIKPEKINVIPIANFDLYNKYKIPQDKAKNSKIS